MKVPLDYSFYNFCTIFFYRILKVLNFLIFLGYFKSFSLFLTVITFLINTINFRLINEPIYRFSKNQKI